MEVNMTQVWGSFIMLVTAQPPTEIGVSVMLYSAP